MDGGFVSAVFVGTLWFSLWFAAGSTLLAVSTASASNEVRRLAVGLALMAAFAAALWRHAALERALHTRPWLVGVIAAVTLIPSAIDGAIGNPYLAICMTAVGLAVIVATDVRTVWLCVLVLDVGYGVIVLTSHSVTQLRLDGDLGGVLGSFFGCQFAALLLLGLKHLVVKFMAERDVALASMRAGVVPVPPTLARALGAEAAPQLQSPPPRAQLTPKEIDVVELLASGLKPKQIAFQRQLGLPTVRTHIANAKRKTGAKTLRELAAATTQSEWPDIERLR